MSKKYWFREVDDVGVLTSLLSACYEMPYSREYVAWMGRVNRWFVAYQNFTPVGAYGLAPMIWRPTGNGVLVDVGLCNNVGVVREHRGTGLFASLGRYALGEFGASGYVGVSNDLAVKGHLDAGWSLSHKVVMMEGVLPPDMDSFPADPHESRHERQNMWREWRYSKPKSSYCSVGGIVFQEYDGVLQLVESGDYRDVARVAKKQARVGVMVSDCGPAFAALMGVGFVPRFVRNVVVRDVMSTCSKPRVEPCDYDVI